MDICCLSKCVWMTGECVCVCVYVWESVCVKLRGKKMQKMWIFDSISVLLKKSVLIFHHWGFYGTDSIHEKSDGHSLIFQVQLFICVKKRRASRQVNTLQTDWCTPAVLDHTDWIKMEDGTYESVLSALSFNIGLKGSALGQWWHFGEAATKYFLLQRQGPGLIRRRKIHLKQSIAIKVSRTWCCPYHFLLLFL